VEANAEGAILTHEDESTEDGNARDGKFEEVEDELVAASKDEDWKEKSKL